MGTLVEVPEGQAPSPAPEPPARDYFATVFPGPDVPIPRSLGAAIQLFEADLGMPVWVLVQDHSGPLGHLDTPVFTAIHGAKDDLSPNEPIALLVQSPGGIASASYQIARFLQRRCGGFTAVVAKEAWSAATLLVVGANRLVMGPDACLGPLDAQLFDPDSETQQSALDEVQALERLHSHALEYFDEFMMLLLERTGKRIGTLVPQAVAYATGMMRPLLDQIDVVHYNERSRILKVAEEYAKRLLEPQYGEEAARSIAARLVSAYPEHSFPIDIEEAREIGLVVEEPTENQCRLLEGLWPLMSGQTVIGQVKEMSQG